MRVSLLQEVINELLLPPQGRTRAFPPAILSELASWQAGQGTDENAGSEWVWRRIGSDARLAAFQTSDTDGDGLREFCDEWGNPMVFIPSSWCGEEFLYVRSDGTRVPVGRMGYLKGPFELFSLGRDGAPLTHDEIW